MSDFKRVLSDGGWNLLGNALPLLAAVAAVPFLVDRMGVERFGILSLVWVLVGYFSALDLGMGRALTKLVAERIDDQDAKQLSSLCSTGTAAVAVLGLTGAGLLALLTSQSTAWLVRMPPAIQSEARATLILIAVGIPAVACTAALRGILEGFQAFRLVNMIRIPAGIAMFAAPCIAAAFTPRLDIAVGALLLTRLLFLGVHVIASTRLCELSISAVDVRWLRPLLAFGGWLTVSNTLGPVIVYVDRFVIGAMLPPALVGYYSAPFEVVSRLLIFPLALCSSLFPALTRSNRRGLAQGGELRRKAFWVILSVVLPVSLVGIAGAELILREWLGAEFATQGALTMQILFVGFTLNSLSQLPFAGLHSLGRTRDTALLHLCELPAYVGMLLVFVQVFGLPGAAAAWTLRALVDCVALSWMLKNAERTAHAASNVRTCDAVLR